MICSDDLDECGSHPCGTDLTCLDSNDGVEIIEALSLHDQNLTNGTIPIDSYLCIPAIPTRPPPENILITTYANLSNLQSYQNVSWTPAASPDVQGYILYLNDSTGASIEISAISETHHVFMGHLWRSMGVSGPFFADAAVATESPAGRGTVSPSFRIYYTVAPVAADIDRVSSTSISLTWDAPDSVTEAPVMTYHIVSLSRYDMGISSPDYVGRNTSSASLVGVLGHVSASNAEREFTASGLSASRLYLLCVVAENSAGLSSCERDNVVQVTTPPDAPFALQWQNSTTSSIRMIWAAQVHPEDATRVTAFHVYISDDDVSFHEIAEVDSVLSWTGTQESGLETHAFTVTNLEGSEKYHFRVSAESEAGEGGISASLQAYTASVQPGAPYAPTTTDYANTTAITVRWTAVSAHREAPVQQILLWQDEHLIMTVNDSSVRQTIVSNLSIDTNYSLTISTINRAGESDRSPSRSLYTAPKPPSRVYTAPGVAEYHSLEGSLDSTRYANASSIQIQWEVTPSTGAPVLEYRLYVKPVNSTSEWHLNAVVPRVSTGTLFTGRVGGLIGGQQYDISVTAWNGAGEGPHVSRAAAAFTAPGVAEPQIASESESTAIHISWGAILSHAMAPLEELNLLCRNVSDDSSTLIVLPLNLQDRALTIPNLKPSTLYGPLLRLAHGLNVDLLTIFWYTCTRFFAAGDKCLWI
eukprot:SAG31_NODE_1015_length_10366_cov_47.726113_2_plen_700_part_00